MSLEHFHRKGFIDEIRTSLERIRKLTDNALEEAALHEIEHIETDAGSEHDVLFSYIRELTRQTATLSSLLRKTQASTALVRTEKNVAPEYRLTEDGNGNAFSETSLVVARPSLLQLVTDSVPAIDLDNRQDLMHSIVEIMRQNDQVVPNTSNTAIQTTRSTSMPLVTIVEQPIISDVNMLKYLFQPKKLVDRKQPVQVDFS